MTWLYCALAAVAEIAGCFAFWAWLRLDRSPLWLAPGLLSLALFAYLLTRVDSAAAGRAYASYGGSISSPRSPGCGSWSIERRTAGTCSAPAFAS